MEAMATLKSRRQPVRQQRRLQASRDWARSLGPGPHGRRVVHKYSRANKVELLCAIKDLESLGVKLDPGYVQQLRESIANASKRKKSANEIPDGYGTLWNDEFSFIAGHTSGGWPYGVTWEEIDPETGNLKQTGKSEDQRSVDIPAKPSRNPNDDIPF